MKNKIKLLLIATFMGSASYAATDINDFSAEKTLTQPTWIKYQHDDLDAAKAEINNKDAWYKSENGERVCGFIYDGQLFINHAGNIVAEGIITENNEVVPTYGNILGQYQNYLINNDGTYTDYFMSKHGPLDAPQKVQINRALLIK